MAAAVAAIFGIADRQFNIGGQGGAGWVGSKAGEPGHFVTVSATGYIDQAAAAAAAVGAVRVGILTSKIASTVAADSDDALKARYRIPTQETEIELPLVTNSDVFITPANTHVGDLVGLYRRTPGDYAWDTNGTSHAKVKKVDIERGTATCTLLATMCLP